MYKYYSLDDYEVLDWAIDIQKLLPYDMEITLKKFIGDIRFLDIFLFNTDNDLSAVLDKLSMKQYPEIGDLFADEKLNVSNAYLENMYYFPIKVYKIITDQKAGKKAASLYADFKSMKSKTAQVELPDLWNEADHKKLSSLSPEQWKEECAQHNDEARLKFNYDQKRKTEFMKIVRKAMLRFMPEIQNFGPGEIIVYDNAMNNLYDTYKNTCETLVKRIDYGLEKIPFELGNYKEVLEKKISQLSPKKKAEGDAKQKIRWMSAKK